MYVFSFQEDLGLQMIQNSQGFQESIHWTTRDLYMQSLWRSAWSSLKFDDPDNPRSLIVGIFFGGDRIFVKIYSSQYLGQK